MIPSPQARRFDTPQLCLFASWAIMAIGLIGILHLHLLLALLAGLLVYQLVHTLAPLMQRRFSDERARLIAVAFLAAVIIGLLTAAVLAGVAFMRSEAARLPMLYDRLTAIIAQARLQLPGFVVDYLPDNPAEIRATVTDWVTEHTQQLQVAGKEAITAFVHLLIGMVLGAMIALQQTQPGHVRKPLALELGGRAELLSNAFQRVVFAQVRISLLNTAFTALFLLVALPLFGVRLPLSKTLVLVTFVVGLLPVVGNLISNTLIVLVGVSVSLSVGIAALVFLILIHKLEYFLNARIVGARIQASSWEILLAMLILEAAFGVPGLVAAPIYYAYLKSELARRHLV
ncbi:AI-2E family transporter [Pigmentiphaga litoralis]|uniref:AI-2E family transporter n=1 Tax=Pigmentiphaga litoralis TaxID=516702 RepID=UPI003B42B467